jgi:cytochrome c553
MKSAANPMKILGFFRPLAAAALSACLAGPVAAQSAERLYTVLANPPLRSASVEAGRKLSSFCSNCHGAEGVSAQTEVPNLAGQHPIYLLNQMDKFASGQRKDPWMEPAIRMLGEEERLHLVVFYATRPVAPNGAGEGVAPDGMEIYRRTCIGCHGERGRGAERFPRLAGQQKDYLIRSLTGYRERTGVRREPEMLGVAATLKDADIRALADYLSALR